MTSFALLAIGALAGLLAGWFIGSRRREPSDGRIERELRDQISNRQSELSSLRGELGQAVSARASAETARDGSQRALAEAHEAGRAAHDATLAAQIKAEGELASLRQSYAETGTRLATAEAELSAQQKLVSSLQEAAVEQRKLHEQFATKAASEEVKTVADLDLVRATLADANSRLSQATAELKARDESLSEAQKALAESKAQGVAEVTRALAEKERAAAAIRELDAAMARRGSDLATAQAQLEAEKNALVSVRGERDGLIADRTRLQDQVLELRNRTGELEAQAKFLAERLTAERSQMEIIQEKFGKEFEAISNKLLVDSSSKFSQQSSESLEKLLTPLRENLTSFKASLDTTRSEAAVQSAVLKENIAKIGSEAATLSKALKGDAKTLGNWGENMLDQLLEKSGLQKDVHYRRQRGEKGLEGDQKYLDVVIDLPEKRHLIIDSKVSLRAFEEMINSTDETLRMECLDRHVEATRRHIRELGDKRYHDTHGINTPDFVLMYIPIEAAYFSAIAREPTLFAEGLDRDVVLITNSTLLATLRTVSNVWRLADQQKNAIEIADRGGKLYDKFVGFIEDLAGVGEALNDGQRAWEAATNKLHTGTGNLVRQAEQLKSLGAKASKSLPAVMLENSGSTSTAPQLSRPS
jgi:DNA recombination protein RmuC